MNDIGLLDGVNPDGDAANEGAIADAVIGSDGEKLHGPHVEAPQYFKERDDTVVGIGFLGLRNAGKRRAADVACFKLSDAAAKGETTAYVLFCDDVRILSGHEA